MGGADDGAEADEDAGVAVEWDAEAGVDAGMAEERDAKVGDNNDSAAAATVDPGLFELSVARVEDTARMSCRGHTAALSGTRRFNMPLLSLSESPMAESLSCVLMVVRRQSPCEGSRV